MRNSTLREVVDYGAKACKKHGFSFVEIYQVKNDSFVGDGWDRYIISPCHVSEDEYIFIGIVREDGTYEITQPRPTQ